MSFLKELRDAASKCPDVLICKLLRDAADNLQACVAVIGVPTKQRMIDLNAAWVRAVKVLEKAYQTPDTPPRSDAARTEPERIAA
jgi:hypothetical protein